MIKLDKVWFKYDNRWIFKDLSIDIDGGFILFRGPNGCGKTTLAKIISGLLKPNKGTVYIEDVDIYGSEDAPNILDKVIYVHDKPIILKGSVRYNASYGIMVNRRREGDINYVNKLMKLFKIEALADKDAKKLSAGQQQIVSLIRALAVRPKYLILDEPLQYLDDERRELVIKYLQKIIDEDTKVIVATHETELLRYADKIYVFQYDGRIRPIE